MWRSATEVANSWRKSYKLKVQTYLEFCICAYVFVVICFFVCFCICIGIVLYLQCIDDGNLIMNGDRRKILTGDFRESNRA